MKRWKTVAVVGVGLIGGSIGLALRERRLADRVVGIGRRTASLRKARQRGAVDATTTRLDRGVAEADLIVFCTPVESIVPFVLEARQACRPGTLMTDVGSTKEEIVRRLDRELHAPPHGLHFVGSHPMAGSEKTGPEFARGDLFVGRAVVVTPTRATRDEDRAAVEAFWKALGGEVFVQKPGEHDRAVAAISHLPHLVASAVAAGTPESLLPLVAGGWLDTTRKAAGDVELWRQILMDNRHHVLKSLGKFEKVLASFRDALESGDEGQLVHLLELGKRKRDAVGN